MESGGKKGSWLRAIPRDELEEMLRTGSLTGISLVSTKTVDYVLYSKERWSMERNRRLFLAYDHGTWIAADNTSGDFFVEEFKSWEAAIAWLRDPTLDPEVAESRFSPVGMAAA